MDFDEAIDKYKSYKEYGLYPVFTSEDVYTLLEELKKEYAQTVDMTKEQRDLIFDNRYSDRDKLYEIMGTEDGYYFDSLYWGNLEPHEVAQAYLHPETIKIIDE